MSLIIYKLKIKTFFFINKFLLVFNLEITEKQYLNEKILSFLIKKKEVRFKII
jgi:hypothetical protein